MSSVVINTKMASYLCAHIRAKTSNMMRFNRKRLNDYMRYKIIMSVK